jgi:hypothetical protein
MTPASLDYNRAKHNPWGLTPHQCMALRLVCQHGGAKRVAYETEVSSRLIEHHLYLARKRMGMLGADIRLFLEWDRWIRKQK